MRVLAISTVLTLALDQFSKWLVVQSMNLQTVGEIAVLPPYLTFRMAWNRGVNFGLLSDDGNLTRWLLIALALIISAWVLWWMRTESRKTAQIAAGLLIGGALGNVVDRIIYGAVADFLNISCCGIDNPFAFNIADVAIFAGAFGLILFTGEKKTP